MSSIGTPSAFEIEREVATLRDIRRRSSQQGPGSIPLDPDLPPNGMVSASAGGYWDNYGQQQTASKTAASADGLGSSSDGSDEVADDPSHLFWVPAHLHPELAPGEFRTFLKEHTRANPDGTVGTLSRSFSGSSSTGLGRKKSMLSKQYKPSLNDHVEDETVVTVKRNRSSIFSSAGPTLTISDLQKLEELAEEAARSDDPSKLRSVLRRSLSLNVAPSFIDQMDDMPDTDEADAPIIVPRPGQILRRTARTKIRKPGLPGDGGGHRFASSRRSGRNKADGDTVSDNGHDGISALYDIPPAAIRISEENDRPLSYSEEAFILDAYGAKRDSTTSTRSSTEEDDLLSTQSHSTLPTTAPPSTSHSGHRPHSPPHQQQEDLTVSPPRGSTVRRVSPPTGQPRVDDSELPPLHHPTPHRHLDVPPGPPSGVPRRTPSPTESEGRLSTSSADPFRPITSPGSQTHSQQPMQSHSQAISPSVSPAPSVRSTKSNKEKEKKGLLKGMWGGDKKKEKEKQEASRESAAREGKDKDSGFFGSLFGKKKHEEEHTGRGLLSGAGPAAAAALLGASKTKQSREPSPGPGAVPGGNPWARYPIHVERAVYRLSHIKLANPRRPLYEQVLISNLMFWYLGVINKVTPPTATPNATANGTPMPSMPSQAGGTTGSGAGPPTQQQEEQNERLEQEKTEKERQEREEKERAERERLEAEARDRERQMEKESRKRGTLVKSPPPGSGPSGRRAEMPVRGPQYDVQHQMMEQERGPGGYNGPPGHSGRPTGRANSAPGGGPPPEHLRRGEPYYSNQQQQGRGPPPPHHSRQAPPHQDGPPYPLSQYQQQPPYGQTPYDRQGPHQGPPTNYSNFAPGLPPGAMAPPPMGSDQWLGSATSRDSPYNVSPSVNLVAGQAHPNSRAKSPPLPPAKGYPNGPISPSSGPQQPRPGPGPGRSASGDGTRPGPGPGPGPGFGPPGPGRPPQRSQGPSPPPPGAMNGASWPLPPQQGQRRGSSPQPPMDRVRSNPPPGPPMDDMPLAYQQQNYSRERSSPIHR